MNSYMNSIARATSRRLTINVGVNKTVTTTYKSVQASIPTTTNLAASSITARGNSMGLGTLVGNMIKEAGRQGTSVVEVPVYLDGREIARASAKYNEAELNKLSKRKSRKRGE